MSTEDRKALPIPPDLFDALLRAIRETVRVEMRAEFEARRAAAKAEQDAQREMVSQIFNEAGRATRSGPATYGDRSYGWDKANPSYQVPTTMHGQPI